MRVPISGPPPTAKDRVIDAEDEWSPLRAVIVGRAEHSCFPSLPLHLVKAFMPRRFAHKFRPYNPFPADVVEKATWELDNFARVLQHHGVRVYRPDEVDWIRHGGYTGAMPRDRLLTVGTTLIESLPAWACRRDEVALAYSTILSGLSHPEAAPYRVFRAPVLSGRDTLLDGKEEDKFDPDSGEWIINNTRPGFDAADFMRFGKYIVGQVSHATNTKGFEMLRSLLPDGYTLELLHSESTHALHIDTTILPLRKGLLVYNPEYVKEATLRGLRAFDGWALHPYPFRPPDMPADGPPQHMASSWLVLNGLSLDEQRFFVEAKATQFASWIRDEFGMEPILLPFQNVNSLGGSFHCATVDLVRG